MSKLLTIYFSLSEMYYCEYYILIMASLRHFKCPQLFLENYCGLSVLIYWYLMEPTHPSLQGSILEGGGFCS